MDAGTFQRRPFLVGTGERRAHVLLETKYPQEGFRHDRVMKMFCHVQDRSREAEGTFHGVRVDKIQRTIYLCFRKIRCIHVRVVLDELCYLLGNRVLGPREHVLVPCQLGVEPVRRAVQEPVKLRDESPRLQRDLLLGAGILLQRRDVRLESLDLAFKGRDSLSRGIKPFFHGMYLLG